MQLRYSLTVIVLLLSFASHAQGNQHMMITSAQTSGIRVDGVLDDADWALVEPATDFVQFNPTEGEPATQRTEVRVLYGANAIYVGAMMYDDDPAGIRKYLARRDQVNGADFFLVVFDSYNDLQTGYEFLVTAAGVQWDALATLNNEDSSWDAVWSSAARITSEGWIVEMEIPYSQLRFSEGETSWGINFVREIQRNGEKDFWAPITRENSNTGFVRHSGRLAGLNGISPRRTLQATPYSLARANTFEDADEPGATESDFSGDVGGDIRFGLSSNITVDATINPDFGQVDADPAELNLSTFETFFSERRPFFLEGTQIFDYSYGSGDGALLYTRRIGASAPIIGATKISGRLPGGTSFGLLAASTGDDFDPTRWYGVARVKQQFGNQDYIAGGITGFSHSPESGEAGSRSLVGGADWRYLVGSNEAWLFEGTLTGSVQTQTNTDFGDPTQRGYALYLGFDKVRGFFTPGSGFRVYSDQFQMNDVGRFRQNNLIQARLGSNLLWNSGNPIGPFRRINTGGFVDQNWSYNDGLNRGLGINLFNSGELLSFQQLELNAWADGIGGYDVRETRGLGPFKNLFTTGFGFDFRSDSRRRFVFSPEVDFRFSEDGGNGIALEGDIEWSVSDRVRFSVNADIGFEDNFTAWAANEGFARRSDGLYVGKEANTPDALGANDLFRLDLNDNEVSALLEGVGEYAGGVGVSGATGYYAPVFGSRDTRSFDISTRTNVIFSPKLSLQFYGQLFTARGQFDDFQLLASPDELRPLDDAYPKRRDFSFQSLNANVVLRWEYRPGSTLFVVWTQARNEGTGEELLLDGGLVPSSPYDVSTGSQVSDTFSIFPQNAFLVKLSYLLMR